MPHDDPNDPTWRKVHELAEECQGESNSFEVVSPFAEDDRTRPLYVLIHPGDTTQTRSDVYGSDDPQGIMAYSWDCQAMMAGEMAKLMDMGWDVAVLHRFSSSYGFGTGNSCRELEDAIDKAHRTGATLFGDKLRAAADWLLKEAGAAERPAVAVSGSWSMARGGCVADVGRRLERAGIEVRLAASACISPDGNDKEWMPKAGKARIDKLAALWTPAAAPRMG